MRITTAGESHGRGLYAILEGIPAGLEIDLGRVDAALSRRAGGYGRGARQALEQDRAELLAGVRHGVTLGSPIALSVLNHDSGSEEMPPLTRLRPGHADLAGMLKFGASDARGVSERASARETAIRVAAGEICRILLEKLNIFITGYVRSVGTVCDENDYTFHQIRSQRRELLGMMDERAEREAVALIDEARAAGDTLGGVSELRVYGLKSGFGSCMTYAEKLDARLASALMSVQAIKGVEVGLGFVAAALRGSSVHDGIYMKDGKYAHLSNRAGGIEGGMSNGEEIVLRAAMKPVPTLMCGLGTVDSSTGEPAVAAAERSDICAVTACLAVLEAALASELCAAVLDRLGGDTVRELEERYGRLPQ